MSVTLNIVNRWQYYVCCMLLGETKCTLFIVLWLINRCMCQCGLHVVHWSHICILQNLAVYRSTFIPFLFFCGTILLTLCSMVWDWRVSRAGPMFFYWPMLLAPFLYSTVFLCSSFILQVGIVGLGSFDR